MERTEIQVEEARPASAEKSEANTLIATGVGIGVFGAVSVAVGGALCPVCVVAAPALIGLGAFRRWRAARK